MFQRIYFIEAVFPTSNFTNIAFDECTAIGGGEDADLNIICREIIIFQDVWNTAVSPFMCMVANIFI